MTNGIIATQAGSPISPHGNFPFMKFPSEIRLMIYKELMVNPTGIECALWMKWRREPQLRNVFNVFKTSRRIYQESSSVFFGQNTFIFFSITYLGIFLSGIRPESRAHITQIKFAINIKPLWRHPTLCSEPRAVWAVEHFLQQTSLHTLHIINTIDDSLYTYSGFPLCNQEGLDSLLSIRGLQKLDIKIAYYRSPIASPENSYGRKRKYVKDRLQYTKMLHVLLTKPKETEKHTGRLWGKTGKERDRQD